MKNLILSSIFIILTTLSHSQNNFIQLADSFLKKHVKDGLVDYPLIKEEPLELFELLNKIALENIPQDHEKAYLINAYNILVIASVVDAYPINCPCFFRK